VLLRANDPLDAHCGAQERQLDARKVRKVLARLVKTLPVVVGAQREQVVASVALAPQFPHLREEQLVQIVVSHAEHLFQEGSARLAQSRAVDLLVLDDIRELVKSEIRLQIAKNTPCCFAASRPRPPSTTVTRGASFLSAARTRGSAPKTPFLPIYFLHSFALKRLHEFAPEVLLLQLDFHQLGVLVDRVNEIVRDREVSHF